MLTDWIQVVEQYLARQPSGQVTFNTRLWSVAQARSDRSAGCVNMFYPDCIYLYPQQALKPDLLCVRKRGWRASCVKRIRIWQLLNYVVIDSVCWKHEIGKDSKPYSNSSSVLPFQPRRMRFPLGKYPTRVGLRGGWSSTGPAKKKMHQSWRLLPPKNKRNLSDSENEAIDFFRFIVIASLELVYLTKFSFIIERIIATNTTLP